MLPMGRLPTEREKEFIRQIEGYSLSQLISHGFHEVWQPDDHDGAYTEFGEWAANYLYLEIQMRINSFRTGIGGM